MASEQSPLRLVHGGASADANLRRALGKLQSRAPSIEDRARLQQRMAALAGGTATGTFALRAAAETSRLTRIAASAWAKGALIALFAAGTASYVLTRHPAPPTQAVTPPARPVVPVALPAVTPAIEAALAASADAETPTRAPLPPDPNAELRLLKAAQAALDASPARALTLTQQHAARYPHSALAQERELLSITALVRLGRAAEARQRAERFQQRYPNSAYAHRIAAALPASSPSP